MWNGDHSRRTWDSASLHKQPGSARSAHRNVADSSLSKTLRRREDNVASRLDQMSEDLVAQFVAASPVRQRHVRSPAKSRSPMAASITPPQPAYARPRSVSSRKSPRVANAQRSPRPQSGASRRRRSESTEPRPQGLTRQRSLVSERNPVSPPGAHEASRRPVNPLAYADRVAHNPPRPQPAAVRGAPANPAGASSLAVANALGLEPSFNVILMIAMLKSFVTKWRVRAQVRIAAKKRQQELVNAFKKTNATRRKVRVQGFVKGLVMMQKQREQHLNIKAINQKSHMDHRPTSFPYWEDPYDGETIRMTVHSVSIAFLFHIILHPFRDDKGLVNLVLMTHRTFLCTEHVLQYLVLRYRSVVPRDVEVSVKLRALIVIKTWIRDFFYDFIDSPEAASTLTAFLDEIIAYKGTDEEVKNEATIVRALFVDYQNHPEVDYTENGLGFAGAKALVPGPLGIHDLSHGVRSIPPLEVARQLTLIEYALFYAVRPKEYLSQNWQKHPEEAPNLGTCIAQFNRIAEWSCTEILREDKPEDRAEVVCHMIDVASAARALENFSTVMAIVVALESPAVSRLKHTWALVPPEMQELAREHTELMSFTHNARNYMDALASAVPPAVPCLAFFLQRLTFIDDGNDDMVDGMLNVEKHRMTAEVVNTLLRLRAHHAEYCVHPLVSVMTYLLHTPTLDDDAQYATSLELEARGEDLKLSGSMFSFGRGTPRTISYTPLEPFSKPTFEIGVDPSFMTDIKLLLKTRVVDAGEVFVTVGDPAHDLCFVARGTCEATTADSKECILLQAGSYFGEECVVDGQKSPFNVRATTKMEIKCVSRDNYVTCARRYADVLDEQQTISRVRSSISSEEAKHKVVPKWIEYLAKQLCSKS